VERRVCYENGRKKKSFRKSSERTSYLKPRETA